MENKIIEKIEKLIEELRKEADINEQRANLERVEENSILTAFYNGVSTGEHNAIAKLFQILIEIERERR